MLIVSVHIRQHHSLEDVLNCIDQYFIGLKFQKGQKGQAYEEGLTRNEQTRYHREIFLNATFM